MKVVKILGANQAVHQFPSNRNKEELRCGKFQYLVGLIVYSVLACTFEPCIILGYMYLDLTFEFEVMGLESAGSFSGTFR